MLTLDSAPGRRMCNMEAKPRTGDWYEERLEGFSRRVHDFMSREGNSTLSLEDELRLALQDAGDDQ